MATLPTPPAAPVTSTSPFPGVTPCRSSARTQSMAVYPAVPMAMACVDVKAEGVATSQLPSRRALPASPPQWLSPTPKPFTRTRSPGLKDAFEDSTTSPAASMPGTMGNFRMTGALPVMASASL